MSVQANCSRCDFTRRFSDGLAGRFFRCPKCKKGVIAVPDVDVSESEEVPLRLSSSSFENPFLAVAKRLPAQKVTQDMTLAGSTAEGTLVDADGPSGPKARKARAAKKNTETEDDSGSSEPPGGGAKRALAQTLLEDWGGEVPVKHKGEVATARRILVECGLCGFLVRIPAEFFGKTVHCPECAGNTIFSESTLDPVKDELLDRLAMETQERRVLFPKQGNQTSLSEVVETVKRGIGNNALKSFLLGVGLGLMVLLAVFLVVEGQRASAREAFVKQAERDGWRYATAINAGSDVFHEPWCTDLEAGSGRRISSDDYQQSSEAIRLHDCE
jgi:hypothetical protein